ncbi:MAG: TIM barrel protein [Candidatus Odinarchaeota archaeon]|nr:TIM barrel protein [Candidatus Odinarchaeota archaeon]
MPRFGPSGIPSGFKGKMEELPEYLNSVGFDAYEYVCFKEIRIKESSSKNFRKKAEEYDIYVAFHQPVKEDIVNLALLNGVDLCIKKLRKELKMAHSLGASRFTLKIGGNSLISRSLAFYVFKEVVKGVLKDAKNFGILLALENRARVTEFGSIWESLSLCREFDNLTISLDIPHLYAVTDGKIEGEEDFVWIFNFLKSKLGNDKLENPLIYFYKVDFDDFGEKEHVSLKDKRHGPDYVAMVKAIKAVNLDPTLICSSPLNDFDCLYMKEVFYKT